MPNVADRCHHQVPRGVRKLVQQHDRALATVGRRGSRSPSSPAPPGRTRSRLGDSRLLHVSETPRRPELPHRALLSRMIARLRRRFPGGARAVRIHREPEQDRLRAGARIGVVVIHTMEIAERDGRRRDHALAGSRTPSPRCPPTTASMPRRRSSACARTTSPGTLVAATASSIGIELAGFAGQRCAWLGRRLQPGRRRAGGAAYGRVCARARDPAASPSSPPISSQGAAA